MVETDGILFLTMGVFLVSRGHYYWSWLVKGCSATKCAFWDPLVNEYSLKHFSLHLCFFFKLHPLIRDSGKNFESKLNLILNCPQSHGGLYNKMLGVPRGALIDKTSRRVLFGCWWFACLSLRKVDAIGINGLQMMQRETNSVKGDWRQKAIYFSEAAYFEISTTCDKKTRKSLHSSGKALGLPEIRGC